MSYSRYHVAQIQPVAYCQACGMQLTRQEADYHRSQCHAFVEQDRIEQVDDSEGWFDGEEE